MFLRPSNGIYLPPKVLRLEGKSTVYDVAVEKKDMPNFFIEAVAVADGRVNSEVKEIIVPPEKRILNVEIKPSAETYKPGEKAKVKIKLTDLNGEPFIGSTVVAIYDKSLEYISGGSNVPDIKEFFWKWRRSHYPNNNENSLARWFAAFARANAKTMANLGIFGGTVAEEMDELSQLGDSGVRTRDINGPVSGFGGRAGVQFGAVLGARGEMAKSMAMPAAAPMTAAPTSPTELAGKLADMSVNKRNSGGQRPRWFSPRCERNSPTRLCGSAL